MHRPRRAPPAAPRAPSTDPAARPLKIGCVVLIERDHRRAAARRRSACAAPSTSRVVACDRAAEPERARRAGVDEQREPGRHVRRGQRARRVEHRELRRDQRARRRPPRRRPAPSTRSRGPASSRVSVSICSVRAAVGAERGQPHVDALHLRQPAQRQHVALARQLLAEADHEVLVALRRDREHPRGELVARRLLEQRRILPAVEEVLVGAARAPASRRPRPPSTGRRSPSRTATPPRRAAA